MALLVRLASRRVPLAVNVTQERWFTLSRFVSQLQQQQTTTDSRDSLPSSTNQLPAKYKLHFSTTISRIPALNGFNQDIILQAVTHPSFLHGKVPTNDRMAFFGDSILRLRTTEALYVRFPRLPRPALQDAVELYVGDLSLAAWGKFVGLNQVMRWKSPSTDESSKVGETTVLASVVRSLVAAAYHGKGMPAAAEFIDKNLLSREIDLQGTLPLANPKALLTALMVRYGRPKPESRILAESGRVSNASIFRVGVFSGDELLGEATATSIKRAETLAAKYVLQEHFLEELQNSPVVDSNGEVVYLKVADTPPIV